MYHTPKRISHTGPILSIRTKKTCLTQYRHNLNVTIEGHECVLCASSICTYHLKTQTTFNLNEPKGFQPLDAFPNSQPLCGIWMCLSTLPLPQAASLIGDCVATGRRLDWRRIVPTRSSNPCTYEMQYTTACQPTYLYPPACYTL